MGSPVTVTTFNWSHISGASRQKVKTDPIRAKFSFDYLQPEKKASSEVCAILFSLKYLQDMGKSSNYFHAMNSLVQDNIEIVKFPSKLLVIQVQ